MDFNKEINNYDVSFEGLNEGYFLIGLLSAFNNAYQAAADAAIGEISWKQTFAIICINMCKEAPTINELAGIMESSHQNVKQILLKLEKKGFVELKVDEKDRRKQRVYVSKYASDFFEAVEPKSFEFMAGIFEKISTKDLQTTIKTIARMDQNLKCMKGKDNENISNIQK